MVVIRRHGRITYLYAGFCYIFKKIRLKKDRVIEMILLSRYFPITTTATRARYRDINLRLISPIDDDLVLVVFNQIPECHKDECDCLRFRQGTFVLKFCS